MYNKQVGGPWLNSNAVIYKECMPIVEPSLAPPHGTTMLSCTVDEHGPSLGSSQELVSAACAWSVQYSTTRHPCHHHSKPAFAKKSYHERRPNLGSTHRGGVCCVCTWLVWHIPAPVAPPVPAGYCCHCIAPGQGCAGDKYLLRQTCKHWTSGVWG